MSYTGIVLTERLGKKGLMPVEITRFIKDAGYIISQKAHLSTNCIKAALGTMGWEKNIADNFVLEMILIEDHEKSKITD